jgi:hypothetical protein
MSYLWSGAAASLWLIVAMWLSVVPFFIFKSKDENQAFSFKNVGNEL